MDITDKIIEQIDEEKEIVWTDDDQWTMGYNNGLEAAKNIVIDLLKEQEAVKPEKEHSGSGVTWWNVCGACKTAINPNDKFCHECGRAVKWGSE